MSDLRTPKRYHVTEQQYLNQNTSLEKLKSKLDDLVDTLDSYKEKKNASPAAKKAETTFRLSPASNGLTSESERGI